MHKFGKRKKVPWSLTCALALLPYEPWSLEWMEGVRALAREAEPLLHSPPLIDLYDEGVGAIIEDTVLMN